MKLYVYRNEDNMVVGIVDGIDNAECESLADELYGSNDYSWTYCDGLDIGDVVED